MNWEAKKISDLGRVVTGKTPSTKNRAFYDGEYPFVTPTDLDWQSYYVRRTHSSVTTLAREKHANQFIPEGSTTFTCIGNTIGKCGLTSEDSLTNQQINSIVPNDDHDGLFVYYLLNFNRDKVRSIGLSGGAAQPIINKTTFSNIDIQCPTLPTQKRIAGVLAAYDDLIENNRRRIALLEEAARLIYREWFVHFRFPNHENTKFENGLPVGWERKPLGEIASTNKQSHKKGKLPAKLNYIDIGSVTAGSINETTEYLAEDAPGRARRIAEHADTIWSNVRPNLRAYSLVMSPPENDVFSTGFTVLHAETVSPYFLYLATTNDNFVGHLVNHATGASYPAVRPDDFKIAEIIVPDEELMNQFHQLCEPSFEQRLQLMRQNQALTKARDLLLPRLMDGRIDV